MVQVGDQRTKGFLRLSHAASSDGGAQPDHQNQQTENIRGNTMQTSWEDKAELNPQQSPLI